MRYIVFALLLFTCVSANSASSTITDEFIQILKKNATEKSKGTNDPKKFFSKVIELANKGDPSAQFLLGLTMIKERRDMAQKYLTASARSGCVGAETGLGILAMLNKQSAVGVAHFKTAAKKGDAMAQAAIAGMIARGENGYEKNLAKAYAWLRLAERQTFSNGALRAIHEGMKKLKVNMATDDLVKSDKYFSEISATIPKVNYAFCGQLNVDTSRDPNIAYYYKF